MNDLDRIRSARKGWGFALYAYEPRGEVTLEAHAPSGDVFAWSGSSVASVLAAAFPGEVHTPQAAPTEEDVFS